MMFSVGVAPRLYNEDLRQLRELRESLQTQKSMIEKRWQRVQLRVQLCSVNKRATEAEESPLLRSITRKRLVKNLQRNNHCRELLPSND
jgi:hypothetical protein